MSRLRFGMSDDLGALKVHRVRMVVVNKALRWGLLEE